MANLSPGKHPRCLGRGKAVLRWVPGLYRHLDTRQASFACCSLGLGFGPGLSIEQK